MVDFELSTGFVPADYTLLQQKKADVEEHPWVFFHVGLLFNEPPGPAKLPFI